MTPRRPVRRTRPLIAGLVGLLALLLLTCPLGTVAVQQRLIKPPHFAITLGEVEFAAPCPTQGLDCTGELPFYAVWRGDRQPDGSTTYRQLAFFYLKPRRATR